MRICIAGPAAAIAIATSLSADTGNAHRNSEFRKFILAWAVALIGPLAYAAPVGAQILDLECHRDGEQSWLDYWVDLEKGTITYANANAQGVLLGTVQTYPVKITPETFTFVAGNPVTINRMTGWNTWVGQDPFLCATGTLPPPVGKF